MMKAIVIPEYGIVKYRKGCFCDLDKTLFYLLNNNRKDIITREIFTIENSRATIESMNLYLHVLVNHLKKQQLNFETFMLSGTNLPIYATFTGIFKPELLKTDNLEYRTITNEYSWLIILSKGYPIIYQKIHDEYIVDQIQQENVNAIIKNYNALINNTLDFLAAQIENNYAGINGKVIIK